MYQITDITWLYNSDNRGYSPVLKIFEIDQANAGGNNPESLSLNNYNFLFKLSKDRFCTGYYEKGVYTPCERKNILDSISYNQCRDCENKTGFREAFFNLGKVNENMQVYLSQKHFVYLAVFPKNKIKVGTASLERKFIRLIEQDALYYCFIAESDGFNIQNIEKYISKTFNITEFMGSRFKLKNSHSNIDVANAKMILTANIKKILQRAKDEDLFQENFYDEGEIEFFDNTTNPVIYYPEIVPKHVTYLEDVKYILAGKYLGLRGKYLFVKNANGMEYVFDIRDVVGRVIESYVEEDFSYKLDEKQPQQVGLFG